MKLTVGLSATALVLFGCSLSPPPPAADEGPPIARGDLIGSTEHHGGLPSMPWPKFQAGLAARANEAELAIVLRGHELRERHPGATPSELAEMLARDDVWEQHAKFVQSARRTIVIREALMLS
jgi:hypothetical protein